AFVGEVEGRGGGLRVDAQRVVDLLAHDVDGRELVEAGEREGEDFLPPLVGDRGDPAGVREARDDPAARELDTHAGCERRGRGTRELDVDAVGSDVHVRDADVGRTERGRGGEERGKLALDELFDRFLDVVQAFLRARDRALIV